MGIAPPCATTPGSPLPGWTSRPSSVKTFTFSPSWKRPVRGGGDRGAEADRLRGAEGIEEDHARMVREERPLHLRRPHDARGDDGDEAVEPVLPTPLVEGPQHRLGEGVAHDGDRVDGVAPDGMPQLVRVEVDATERGDRAARGERDEGGEEAGALHEGTGRQVAEPGAARADAGGELVE